MLIIANTFLMTSLSGCATSLLMQAPVTSTHYEKVKITEDTLRAVGYPIDNGSEQKQLVVIGDNYTYLISRGVEKIEYMINDLDPKKLTMNNQMHVTRFKSKNGSDYFSGYLNFTYNSSDGTYNTIEAKILDKICNKRTGPKTPFRDEHTNYLCQVDVTVNIYSSMDKELIEKRYLTRGRQFSMVTTEHSSSMINPSNLVNKLLLFPVTVAFDVVTSPVQAVLLSNQGSK